MDAYVFEAELVDEPGVSRRLAVRGDQTLADLHEELRRATRLCAASNARGILPSA